MATLHDKASGEIVSEAFYLPERRVAERHDLGVSVAAERNVDGWQLVIEAKRFARFVHIVDTHYRAAHDWFHLPPNQRCVVPLIPLKQLMPHDGFVAHASNGAFKADATYAAPAGEVRAVNAISATFYG